MNLSEPSVNPAERPDPLKIPYDRVRLYSVLDRGAQEFCPPFPSRNETTASRSFLEFLRKSPLHPSEYLLARLGSYHPTSGELVSDFETVCYGDTLLSEQSWKDLQDK